MPRNPRTEPPGCHQMGRLCLGEREVCTCETAEPLKTAEITASGLVLHVQRFATCPRSKPKHLDDSIFRHFLEYLRFRLTAYLSMYNGRDIKWEHYWEHNKHMVQL